MTLKRSFLTSLIIGTSHSRFATMLTLRFLEIYRPPDKGGFLGATLPLLSFGSSLHSLQLYRNLETLPSFSMIGKFPGT